MPYTKEQRDIYNVNRRDERRQYCIEKLGGKCVKCGSVKDLEFDHTIPVGPFGMRVSELLTCSIVRLNKELEKCQLLCKACHLIKSTREDKIHGDQTHGTLTSYRYCKCKLCRRAKSEHSKLYNKPYSTNKPELIIHGSYKHFKFCGPPRCNSCRSARREYEFKR